MRVRDWQEIVGEVVEADADPAGWRAVGGDRASGVGEDLFLAHPGVGVYQLKTYAKNPFEVQGVGTRVARKVDGDLASPLPDADEGTGRFAVQSPPEDEDEAETAANRVEEVLRAHADAPTTPADLFDDVMGALDSPAFGPMTFDGYGRPDELDALTDSFEQAQSVLDAELDELVADADVDRGFY
jgi:hypothetical protein